VAVDVVIDDGEQVELGATGVTGKLAIQAARHFGAGRIVEAGRNQQMLDSLPALGADAVSEVWGRDQQGRRPVFIP
jgi:NADPH:quinone reductase-like Zn-dependent oxidoreductase